MIRALPRGVLPLLFAAGLAGCGWHAAGQRPLPVPLRTVYIDFSEPYQVEQSPLRVALQRRLASRGAKIVAQPEPNASTLRLYDLNERREVLAIGQDGTAIEYRLTTTVRFQLLRRGRQLLPEQSQAVSSEYTFNAQQILAKEAEEERLRAYLEGELAELLMLRLEAQLNHLPPAATAAPAATTDAPPAPASPGV